MSNGWNCRIGDAMLLRSQARQMSGTKSTGGTANQAI
jgi:hypothetical protein